MNSKDKGEISQANIELKLMLKGYTILTPRGDNQRYDFVIEKDGKFERVQCKTGRLVNGTVCFKTCSSAYHRGGKTTPYVGDAEYFGVYCYAIDKSYLIPVTVVGKSTCNLRVDNPISPNKNIVWAKEYEI